MSRFEAVEEKQGADQFGIPVVRHLVYDDSASTEAGIIAICPDRDSALYVQQALERLHEYQGSLPAPVQPPEFPASVCPVEVVYGSVEIKEADGNFLPPPMPRPLKPWADLGYMRWLAKTNWAQWRDEIVSNPDHRFCKGLHTYDGPMGMCSKCAWDEVPF